MTTLEWVYRLYIKDGWVLADIFWGGSMCPSIDTPLLNPKYDYHTEQLTAVPPNEMNVGFDFCEPTSD